LEGDGDTLVIAISIVFDIQC